MKTPSGFIDIISHDTGKISRRKILKRINKFGHVFAVHSTPKGWINVGWTYVLSHVGLGVAAGGGLTVKQAERDGLKRLDLHGARGTAVAILRSEKRIQRLKAAAKKNA